jgi:hypothetical protein
VHTTVDDLTAQPGSLRPIPIGTNDPHGEHDHTASYSGADKYNPARLSVALIKSLRRVATLPDGAAFLAAAALTNPAYTAIEIEQEDCLLAVSDETPLSVLAEANRGPRAEALAEAGGHIMTRNDTDVREGLNGAAIVRVGTKGAHTHNGTFTVAENGYSPPHKMYLPLIRQAARRTAAWRAADKIIAMWDTTDPPPAGWVLCDGDNDTPDLTDCFVVPCDPEHASLGQRVDGDGVISGQFAVTSTSAGAAHTHHVPDVSLYPNGGLYPYVGPPTAGTGGSSWTHTHDGAMEHPYAPERYALYFIMYAGV